MFLEQLSDYLKFYFVFVLKNRAEKVRKNNEIQPQNQRCNCLVCFVLICCFTCCAKKPLLRMSKLSLLFYPLLDIFITLSKYFRSLSLHSLQSPHFPSTPGRAVGSVIFSFGLLIGTSALTDDDAINKIDICARLPRDQNNFLSTVFGLLYILESKQLAKISGSVTTKKLSQNDVFLYTIK